MNSSRRGGQFAVGGLLLIAVIGLAALGELARQLAGERDELRRRNEELLAENGRLEAELQWQDMIVSDLDLALAVREPRVSPEDVADLQRRLRTTEVLYIHAEKERRALVAKLDEAELEIERLEDLSGAGAQEEIERLNRLLDEEIRRREAQLERREAELAKAWAEIERLEGLPDPEKPEAIDEPEASGEPAPGGE